MRTKGFIGLALTALPALSQAAMPVAQLNQHAERIFKDSQAVGMVMVVVDKQGAQQRFYGETRPGSRRAPDADSLLRIASLSKLMTSEVLASLALQNRLKLDDPLLKYAPAGARLPKSLNGQPITLLHLATHTSGFPRELPGVKPRDTPVFVWPDQQQRWRWLAKTKAGFAPGQNAQYSNLAYDYLADALASAGGKPYPVLLRETVTAPLAMKDTTFSPSAAQCARLLRGVETSPCVNTSAALGSGGVYSTAADMQRWLQDLVRPQNEQRKRLYQQTFQMRYQRNELRSVAGMDVPGKADALGLGWVAMREQPDPRPFLQKTAGGGGFFSYVAIDPERQTAVWVALTRGKQTRYQAMSDGVNQLLLALNRP